MKVLSFLIIFILIVNWLSCDTKSTEPESPTTLEGGVYFINNNNTLSPIEGALVNVSELSAAALTGSDGTYKMNIDFSEESRNLTLNASKDGYLSSELSILAKKGEQNIVPDFSLVLNISDTTGGILPSDGSATHIVVSGSHPTHLYVSQSGLTETAIIYFDVLDSLGQLLTNDNRVIVSFSILNGPNGGEYLSPTSMTTQNGKVYTVLNTGTIAGPVQLEASFIKDGNVIKTTPIRIAIYGGFPDEDHFSLAIHRVNIAGRVHSGILDAVTAFVGDKYSNPVAPGTIVYFSTDYGIVEGAAVTDTLGRATVNFMSAAPLPPFPAISSTATITGWTYGDTVGFHSIYKTTSVLLTDITAPIWVDPTTFSYTHLNNPVHFDYKVNDIWGYPLVKDTEITVEASGGSLYGDIAVITNDTRISGPGTTDFQFTWAPGDSLEDPLVFISIKAVPPSNGNGYQSVSLSGNRNW